MVPSNIMENITALKFKAALIQISDAQQRVIGRVAEQLPCLKFGHPLYEEPIQELYVNPGLNGTNVMECINDIELNSDMNPNVPILTFNPPVEAFYANFKLTLEEAEFLHNKSGIIFITTLLLDEDGRCYLHVLPGVSLIIHFFECNFSIINIF